MSETVYAIIKDNALVEYPVFAIHILNRSLPWDIVSPVVFKNAKPTPGVLETVTEEHTVVDNVLYVEYKIKPLGLDDFLLNTHSVKKAWSTTPMKPAQLTMLLFTGRTLLERAFEANMDILARYNGYRDFNEMVSFSSSKVEHYRSDAEKACAFRDAFWVAFYEYMTLVESDRKDYPRSLDEVKANLPVLNLG